MLQGATEQDLVESGLDDAMEKACDKTIRKSIENRVSLRTAAWMIGVSKLNDLY